MIELRGITWNHTRGYLPMVATAQRFTELHPDVTISWGKRSLQQFADFPVERLAENYDLLVIDHPSIGSAAEHDSLLPLDELLPAEFLADQAANSVGLSHASYFFAGHQWALAIDAAAPVSGWRPDLLEKAGARPPENWSELLDLAARGLVAFPGVAIDSLCHFYMLCVGLGEPPFLREDIVVSPKIGTRALQMLRELAKLAVPGCSEHNPIAIWELLISGNSAAYCAFAYGYSNYARSNYSAHPLRFGGLVTLDDGTRCRPTLGGAGLAISSRCHALSEAVAYCQFTAGAHCQRGLYFDAGGQPGYRQAWVDEGLNLRTHNFFRDTLPTLDEAWLRPRWNAYLDFQQAAAALVHECVWRGGDAAGTMEQLSVLRAGTLGKETA